MRSESAQKAELQAGLYEVRGLYSKAIADREALDARATRAEAEKAAADTNWQRAKAQVSSQLTQLLMTLQQQCLVAYLVNVYDCLWLPHLLCR